ncbi:MAG: excalibur calcium-binding domain-containing protein [Mycobacteriales bacterium]
MSACLRSRLRSRAATPSVTLRASGEHQPCRRQAASHRVPPRGSERSSMRHPIYIVTALLILSACGGSETEPTESEPTPSATERTSSPSASPSRSPSPKPTATSPSPAPSPTPTPPPRPSPTAPRTQAPPPAPRTQAPPPTKAPTAGASYANCSEVKAAGAAPLRRGEPGYRAGLDRDNDGVACET